MLLFQEEVEFADLALVIIDEQHRFGVLQRQHLLEKSFQNQNPNFQQISPHFFGYDRHADSAFSATHDFW